MKRIFWVIFVLGLSVSLVSCSKKQEALEEMQQPMSPEDLNRIKTGVQVTPEANAPVVSSSEQAAVVSTPEVKSEPLPPAGPYKPSVKEIQTALKNAGYYAGSIDGKLGPKSKDAIKEFQKTNGLIADGKVGPVTWAVLSKYLNVSNGNSVSTAPVTSESENRF